MNSTSDSLPSPSVDFNDKLRNHTWIIVPALDEETAIGTVVSELKTVCRNVIVVDDGSSDRTSEEATAAGAHVLRHVANRGQGASLQTGITFALHSGAECIVTFDADGQHSSSDVIELVKPVLRNEVDLTLGSRFLGSAEKIPFLRRVLLRCAVLFTWASSGLRLTDTHNGLRALSRRAASGIRIRLDRMAHASEILDQVARNRFSFVEVPVHVRYTDYSLAKGQRLTGALKVLFDYLAGRILG